MRIFRDILKLIKGRSNLYKQWNYRLSHQFTFCFGKVNVWRELFKSFSTFLWKPYGVLCCGLTPVLFWTRRVFLNLWIIRLWILFTESKIFEMHQKNNYLSCSLFCSQCFILKSLFRKTFNTSGCSRKFPKLFFLSSSKAANALKIDFPWENWSLQKVFRTDLIRFLTFRFCEMIWPRIQFLIF